VEQCGWHQRKTKFHLLFVYEGEVFVSTKFLHSRDAFSRMSCDCIDKIYDHCLHVMRQQLLQAHTTMYGLCFAYILEITRVGLGHNREFSRVTIRRLSRIQT
jgi:hypothetical protein